MLPANCERREHILGVQRLHNSDRKRPVDRRIRGIECPVPRGEPNLALNGTSQIGGKLERGSS